jgi:hypothetical protein
MCKPTTRLDEPLVGRACCNHLTRTFFRGRAKEIAEQVNPVLQSHLSAPWVSGVPGCRHEWRLATNEGDGGVRGV